MPSIFLLLLLAFLPVLAVAVDTQQPYNITLSSASPLLAYSPNITSNGADGWNVTYTSSPWSSVPLPPNNSTPNLSNSPVGNGSSIHWTNASTASVSMGFYGTGFAILGRLYNGRSELNIDGVVISTTASVSADPVSETRASMPTASTTPGSGPGATSTGQPVDYRPILGQANGMTLGWHTVSLTFYAAENGQVPTGMEVMGARMLMTNGKEG